MAASAKPDSKRRPLSRFRDGFTVWLSNTILGRNQVEATLTRFYLSKNTAINHTVELLEKGQGPKGQILGGFNLLDHIHSLNRLSKDSAILKHAAEVTKDSVVDCFLNARH